MREALKLYLCHFSIDFVHFDTVVVDSICFGTNEINFPVVILLKRAVIVAGDTAATDYSLPLCVVIPV